MPNWGFLKTLAKFVIIAWILTLPMPLAIIMDNVGKVTLVPILAAMIFVGFVGITTIEKILLKGN